MVKEEWYFDKQNSRLQVRIIGICPIQEFFREDIEDSPSSAVKFSGYTTRMHANSWQP
jgi:hypothetical protein